MKTLENISTVHGIFCKDDLKGTIEEQVEHCRTTLQLEHCLILKQVHGTHVINVTTPWEEDLPSADAMVTKIPGIALAIKTADCAPVLFHDPLNQVIGAVHAGWRGAIAGALEETVKKMCEIGAKLENIQTGIGPMIHQESYEVSQAFHDQFTNQNNAYKAFFIPGKDQEHFQFDLPGFVTERLKKIGLVNISAINEDTYINENIYPSYRRATHNNTLPLSERILTVIGL